MHREYDPAAMGLDQIVTGGHDHGHEHGRGHQHDHHHHAHDPAAEHRRLLIMTVLVGLLLAGHLLLPLWRPEWARPFGIPLGLLAAVIGGGRIIYQALAALFEGRVGADIALAIATIAAAVMGEYFVAAEVVFIALVGECLEAYAFGRAQRAIQKLLDLRPRVARVLRDGQEQEIAVEALRVGDSLIVRPGERIAADGAVVAGRSAVDQSTLTGESLPVDKGPGDPVYTGTINAFGRLEIRAEKVGAETTLGQVIRLLAEAQRRKSPLERTADRYARLFLPAVLAAAAVVFIGTNFGALRSWASTGAMVGRLDVLPLLAVLVVACPCALILATPAAVLAATARLARRGVLVKGGAAIERLAAVDCLAFDKTGTLTEGKPELGDVVAFNGWEAEPLLRLAAAAEQSSEHPLARLLVKEARQKGLTLPAVADFLAHPGAGVAAGVEDQTVLVGNLRLFREQEVPLDKAVETALDALDASGQTALLVAVDGQVAGIFGARDRVRQEAHGVIHDLKHLGLKDQTILTGDREAPAQAIARKVHLKSVESELTPGAKADWVHRKQEEGRVVAMIGDGINDAPALAMADVGIALGGVGTDIAAEAGSIVLMGDPLTPLPDAIRLARRTVAIIRQNILFFAFGLNAVAVVLAGLRVLGPVAAAIVHQIGSFLVILNAIRLLGSEGWEQFGLARGLASGWRKIRRFHPDHVRYWVSDHRRGLITSVLGLAAAAYALSGLTTIGPDQAGLLQRFGQYQKALEPGLHWRWPLPIERVTKLEPEQVRVARVGLSNSGAQPASGAVAWSASHGESRDDAALFLTGDENLVELSGVVEYRYGREHLAELYFQAAGLDQTAQAAADGAFREAVGRTPLESILVADRTGFEQQVRDLLEERLTQSGLPMQVERVRVIDAHPPKEVVPAYRDVSAAVSDAARYHNEAQGYAAQQEQAALADARGFRDSASTKSHQLESSARGQQAAFLARQQAHASQPDLTEFRLLWNTIAESYASRPKLILDSRATGRRMLWLADPDRFGLNAGSASLAQPAIPDGNDFPMD